MVDSFQLQAAVDPYTFEDVNFLWEGDFIMGNCLVEGGRYVFYYDQSTDNFSVFKVSSSHYQDFTGFNYIASQGIFNVGLLT